MTDMTPIRPKEKTFTRIMVLLLILTVIGIGFYAYDEDKQRQRLEQLEIESSNQYQQRLYNEREMEEKENLARIQDSIKKGAYRDSIQIVNITTSKPNKDGRIDLDILWKNDTRKVISLISFKVVGMNDVGQEMETNYVRVMGPIKPKKVSGKDTYWESIWNNGNIKETVIRDVYVEFTDGTHVDYIN
jgi:hypothetical protein